MISGDRSAGRKTHGGRTTTLGEAKRGELVDGRLRITGLAAGELGILERYGVGTHGSGGPGQVGRDVVVRD